MNNPDINNSIEFCKFCKHPLTNDQDIDSSAHQDCLDETNKFQTEVPKLNQQPLIKGYELEINSDYKLNADGLIYWLNLSQQELEEFPTDLDNLPALQYLDLSNNEISYIPDNIFSPESKLTELNLSHNYLFSLPNSLRLCSKLIKLWIHHNAFEEYPHVIREIPALEELSIVDLNYYTPKWFIKLVSKGLKVKAEQDDGNLKAFTMSANIHLSYWKQGDDLYQNLVNKGEGVADVIQTLENHKKQMQYVMKHLDDIIKVMKQFPDNSASIEGGTHHIGLYGDYPIIQALAEKELVNIEYYDME